MSLTFSALPGEINTRHSGDVHIGIAAGAANKPVPLFKEKTPSPPWVNINQQNPPIASPAAQSTRNATVAGTT